jgi:hypothetical protein
VTVSLSGTAVKNFVRLSSDIISERRDEFLQFGHRQTPLRIFSMAFSPKAR